MLDTEVKVYVYPDGEWFYTPPEWKSDDYEIRVMGYCDKCDSNVVPHYNEPLASCDCGTQEWYKQC